MSENSKLNEDGFDVDKIVSVDEILKFQAKQRQENKSNPPPLPVNHELSTLINNILMHQKVRLRPLGLEILAQAVVDHLKPEVKNTKTKKV